MTKPFFTGEDFRVFGIEKPSKASAIANAKMLEWHSREHAPLQALAEGYRINLDKQVEENTRLNAQVRTLGEQVEDAKITIGSLRALLALVLGQDRKRGYPTGPEWTSLVAQIDAVLSPRSEQIKASIDRVVEQHGQLLGKLKDEGEEE